MSPLEEKREETRLLGKKETKESKTENRVLGQTLSPSSLSLVLTFVGLFCISRFHSHSNDPLGHTLHTLSPHTPSSLFFHPHSLKMARGTWCLWFCIIIHCWIIGSVLGTCPQGNKHMNNDVTRLVIIGVVFTCRLFY